MKLLIGIPAYNEQEMISQVIKSLPRKIEGIEKIDILVVDDGSTDQTAKIAQNLGVYVLRHILNRGLGGALKTIFSYFRSKNYDILVTFDADGQHNPADIFNLVKPIIRGEKDISIGSRWQKSRNIPFARKIINKFANIITYLLFSVWTSDSQSGLRAFSKKAVQLIDLQSDGMEVSSEFFREIYRHRLRYNEVPIVVQYTSYSQTKGQKLSNAPNVFFHLFMRLLR